MKVALSYIYIYTGVCNCVTGLNSCNQHLAGCTASNYASSVPDIPSILYVGESYNFIFNISYTTLDQLCFLRPLPQGLNFTQLTSAGQNTQYALSGTPEESMPNADYGIAATRGNAIGGFAYFFSFSVQSCSQANAVYPTPPPPSTTGDSSTSSSSSSQTCTTAETGYMRCAGYVAWNNSFNLILIRFSTNQYQTCDHGAWQANQSCGSSLVCQPSGNYVYCVRP